MRLTALAALSLTALGALAQPVDSPTDQRIVLPVSDPGSPVILEVSVIRGTVAVRGHDGQEVIIASVAPIPPPTGNPARDGLRRIPNTSFGLTAEEQDNHVFVSLDPTNDGAGLEIMVPRRTSVLARSVNGDSLRVSGVDGEHELSGVNSDVIAEDISGSLIANTTNGDLTISFTAVAADKSMSFTTFNGDIVAAFPESLAANLRISAGRGDVLTDFDFETQPLAPTIERDQEGGRNRVRVERETRGTIGGGGPELYFKTLNGDIIIRRR